MDNKESYIIRQARVEDAADIARVRVTTWRVAYRGLIAQDFLDRMDIAADSRRWRDVLASGDPDRVYFVARISGAAKSGEQPVVVGYAFAGPHRDGQLDYPAELYAIYILPEYQGRGIGRALVRSVVDWLVDQGYPTMIIYVLKENIPSRRFYEAIGGQLVDECTRDLSGLVLNEVGYGYNLRAMQAGQAL